MLSPSPRNVLHAVTPSKPVPAVQSQSGASAIQGRRDDRQAAALGLTRASVCHMPRAVPNADVAMMGRLDALHVELALLASRMVRDPLRNEGIAIGRDHVRRLMARVRITAIYQRPRTSQRHRSHADFAYLLRSLVVHRPSQVGVADITCLPRSWGVQRVHESGPPSAFAEATAARR
jgi:hypothetical protein